VAAVEDCVMPLALTMTVSAAAAAVLMVVLPLTPQLLHPPSRRSAPAAASS